MGLGRFGGGLGVTRFLANQGADVLVTDLDPEDKLRDSIAQLHPLIDSGSVTLRLGSHNVSDFTTRDLIVANPAVPRPWDNRFLRAAQAAGIPITTEIGLLVERLPDRSRTIGVTGTAGKSTTAALIAHILRQTGHPAELTGNIGGSLLGRIDTLDPQTWIILELSSFMLYWLGKGQANQGKRGGWSPHIAVVTNIAPNHLDWHGTADHYAASKQKLLAAQRPGETAILGESVSHWPTQPGITRVLVPQETRFGPLLIPGAHNQLNAAMAHAAISALSIPNLSDAQIRAAAATFPGLPHRLQLVAERGSIRFYNDSKSTTPDATLLALDAFRGSGLNRVHLIAGGYDKGSDLAPIAAAAKQLASLSTIGATGPTLAAAAIAAGAQRVHNPGTLDAAMADLAARARPGDVVLLSPGCASWDQFTNYEARGDRFAALVRQRFPGPAPARA